MKKNDMFSESNSLRTFQNWIPMYAQHRQKLAGLFHAHPNDIIFIQGATVAHRYGTDFQYPFRQESNFLYLTGVEEPDFSMLLVPTTGVYYLFVPRRDAMYAVWHGFVYSQEKYKSRYTPDEMYYRDELETVLQRLNPNSVHCVGESDAAIIQAAGYRAETGLLQDALAWCRVIKTDGEMQLMREANRVASAAHRKVLGTLKAGMMEYELQALFEYECTRRGHRHQPYGGIHAAGKGSAVLHYVDNRRPVQDGDLVLIDAGAEAHGYAADITRTWPANGHYSEKQAFVYDTVLEMLETSIQKAAPGVEMEQLHLDAARLLLTRFREAELVRGDVDELMDQNIFALFFPHGLGHFLGLDTHDVGGYPKGVERIDRPGLRYLRARRLLEPGMVVTIEPGIYFIPALLLPAFENPAQAPYLNEGALRHYLHFGGIRIEDNLLITASGHENLTDVPKKRGEIESIMYAL